MRNVKRPSRFGPRGGSPVLSVAIGMFAFGLITINLISVEFFEWFYDYSRAHEDWDLDEWAVVVLAFLLAAMGVSAWNWRAAALRERRARENHEEAMRQEATLRRALSKSQQDIKAQNMLMATMSHELRTPLNSILGYSELLEMATKERLSQTEQDQLGMIQGSARILSETINGILEMARLEAEETEPCLEPLAVAETIAEVVDILDIQASGKGLLIEIDSPPSHTVRADRVELRSVLFNVLGNAVKYTNFGSIKITTKEIPDGLSISVSDTGRGMSEDQIAMALAPFGRVAADEREPIEGTGIGLVIVQRVVERHGGRVTIESAPGHGTTVTLTFPSDPT